MKSNEHHTSAFNANDNCINTPATGHYDKGYCNSGFTLVELIVVVAVLAVLALFAIPAYTNYVNMAKIAKGMSDVRLLEKEIDAYFIDKNAYPATLNDIQRGTFLDSWKNPYVYRPVATAGADQRKDRFLNPLNSDFDIYSLGPDGDSEPRVSEPTSLDDIVRGADGGYVGTGAGF